MNANKLFSEFSLKKIWDKLQKHDKAMSSTLLVLSSGNWIEQEDGTFTNTVPYSTFKDTDKLTVDLYDDGTITETALSEYEYVDDETQKTIARYIVNTGDILISVVGTIGLIGIVGSTLDKANQTENCDKIVNIHGIN